LQRTREARLKGRPNSRPNEDSVQKDPRGSSGTASEYSSGRVDFAKNPRGSSEGSSEFASERGFCAEGPERLVWNGV
jgi:hypothetical protein